MKSKKRGKRIKKNGIEVLNISIHGIWLYIKGKEYFLSFKQFPWFKKATIMDIQKVKLSYEHHLYWPKLDVDLELDSIIFPEKYPLQFKS